MGGAPSGVWAKNNVCWIDQAESWQNVLHEVCHQAVALERGDDRHLGVNYQADMDDESDTCDLQVWLTLLCVGPTSAREIALYLNVADNDCLVVDTLNRCRAVLGHASDEQFNYLVESFCHGPGSKWTDLYTDEPDE